MTSSQLVDDALPVQPLALKNPPPALLFEMMRSFITLADTLNLSHAVKQLKSTRQTVRRHISLLEELKDGQLFDVNDRRYALTPLGSQILPEAQDIVASATAWLTGAAGQVRGLQVLRNTPEGGKYFYQQQHPLSRAFSSSSPMLQNVIRAWAVSGGALEHESMRGVRPLCNIFRREQGNLVFIEVGEKSSFVSWFGSTIANSTIGRSIGAMPGGSIFPRLVDFAYSDIERSQGIRLDHIHCVIPKGNEGVATPISYERLMLGARFPDGSPAIVSLVRRTYDIDIDGVSDAAIRRMPEDTLM